MKQSKKAYGFNSMIVRLKVIPVRRYQKDIQGFNSMIVRLKAPYGEIPVFLATLFQFYDSPIKSETLCVKAETYRKVSIL